MNAEGAIGGGDGEDQIEAVANRIAKQSLDVIVEVDGGIDADTAPQAIAAGATALVAGSATAAASPSPSESPRLFTASRGGRRSIA